MRRVWKAEKTDGLRQKVAQQQGKSLITSSGPQIGDGSESDSECFSLLSILQKRDMHSYPPPKCLTGDFLDPLVPIN